MLVNRNASIGHHARLERYVSLGPGVTIASDCHIGKGAMLGAGAVVAPKISVGENSVVAVGAVVAKDVPAHCVVAGNPARIVRSDIAGYKDVSVAEQASLRQCETSTGRSRWASTWLVAPPKTNSRNRLWP